MKDSIRLLEKGAKIQYRISSNDKKPRKFGTQYLLFHSEIHFIDAVEPGDGLNVSQLSEKLGVTHGAITQVADKLLKKRLIEKYKKEDNKKEVFMRLTSEGEIAYKNHKEFHEELNKKLVEYLDNLSETQMEALFGLFSTIEQNLPDLNKEGEK